MTNLQDLKFNDRLVEDSPRNIPAIDNLSIEDDSFVYNDDIVDDIDDKTEYDEKIELKCTQNLSQNDNFNNEETISCSSIDFNDGSNEGTKVLKGKSKFYFPPNDSADGSTQYQKLFTNEYLVFTLENVVCICSNNDSLSENPSFQVKGKLILTNFQLVFIPNFIQSDSESQDERYLSLFNHERIFSLVIPLTFIHELKTCNLQNILTH